MAEVSGKQLYDLMTQMHAEMVDLVCETRELVQEMKAINVLLSNGAEDIRRARNLVEQRARRSSFSETRH